jgi:cytochrome c556
MALPAFAETGKSQASAKLPPSLDSFYPPNAQGPVYVMAMHEMAMPMSGMITDMMEGDMPNAKANFKRFNEQYLRISNMVPEWQSYYSPSSVDKLGAALESDDPAKVMGAMEDVGKSCSGCHEAFMPLAFFKYHWGDFKAISVTNPATKEDMPFQVLMQMLNAEMNGVMNDLGQGQIEAARAHANGLAAQYQALKEACTACHDTERRYFVDADVMGMLGKLQSTMSQSAPDPRAVGEIIQGIGMESCHKCHLVHVPAAFSKN